MELKEQLTGVEFAKKEEKFKKRLQKVIGQYELDLQRELIERLCEQLDIELLDCAAALILLTQANVFPVKYKESIPPLLPEKLPSVEKIVPHTLPLPKTVCYRLEIGTQHGITEDEIKNIFVLEAGVDVRMIGKVEMRTHFTFIELPEGMPPDIYQLLTTVSIRQQALNIKRVKYRDRSPRKHFRRKNKV